ncbi:hypothetical protein [Amycolatopsis sp. NPDC051903]|uniref:hypothetical protein n=1 Tax=Amycolatopsis sp. NPDC051903 TaxID=3363936 RepID=UPI0037BA45A7
MTRTPGPRRGPVPQWLRTTVSARRRATGWRPAAPFVVGLRRTSPAWSTRLDEIASHFH